MLYRFLAAVQRALALNDSWHWSHLILGSLYLCQQQYEQALVEMERAVALGPSEADSRAAMALVLGCMGRTEDALQAATQALRLKPFIADGHLGNVGAAYALAGRYEEARAPCSVTSVVIPTYCLSILCWPQSTAS